MTAKIDTGESTEITLAKSPWGIVRKILGEGDAEEFSLSPAETRDLFTASKAVDRRVEGVRRYRTTEGGPPELLRVQHVGDFRSAVRMSVEELARAAFLLPAVLSKIEDSSLEASAPQRANIVAALGNDLTENTVFAPDVEGGPGVRIDAPIDSEPIEPRMKTREDVAGDLERFAAERGLTELAAISYRLELSILRDRVTAADKALKKPRKWKLKRGSSTPRHASQMHMSDADYEAEQRRLRPGGR